MNPMIFAAATFILSAPTLAMQPVIAPIIKSKPFYENQHKKASKPFHQKETFKNKIKHKKNVC